MSPVLENKMRQMRHFFGVLECLKIVSHLAGLRENYALFDRNGRVSF